MSHCINKNSPEFQTLVRETKMNPIVLAAEVSVWQDEHGLDSFPTSLDIPTANQQIPITEDVIYNFKVADVIENNIAKIKQWESNKSINQDTLYKKIGELGISKQQLDLLKESPGDSVEEKLASLLANYSHVVTINITKDKKGLHEDGPSYAMMGQSPYKNFEFEGDSYTQADELDFDGVEYRIYRKNGKKITQSEFTEFAKKSRELQELTPTTYYDNLTVPGGVNYTENEIKTPGIIPAIKGHAQFATDQGIGWFRSDDRGMSFENKENVGTGRDSIVQEGNEWVLVNDTIGEIERFDNPKDAYAYIGIEYIDYSNKPKTRRILEVQSDLFQRGRDKKDLDKADDWHKMMGIETKANQFLQLLNKGGNWVTFFVKSIVQDSAKRGYKSVLFPTGDTASKVEGHTTLTEYKAVKESRLEQVNKALKWQLERAESYPENDYSSDINKVKLEKEQLEKELEEIEGPKGFAALKPIYNFYENTVTNVLKKQGYNPKVITDEYGNTWNEVTIDESRDFSNILLQKKTATPMTEASPKTIAALKDFLKRIGVEVKAENDIVIKGVKQDANGAALMTQKLIQIANGMEAQALPEEAMHFAVEIIKQKDPALFKKLLSEINKYAIYKEVLAEYGTDPLYQTKDGKPDIMKLKMEAIGKVLAETIINQNENTNETPERIAEVQNWWDKILEFLRNLFLTSGFDAAAMRILSGEDIGTAEDINSDSVYLQKSQQEEVVDKLLTVSRSIKKDTVKNPEGGEEEKYFINDVMIPKRVSNIIKTWFEKLHADDALTDSEYQKALNYLRAEKGTHGHKDLEYIHSLFYDEDGYKRPVELEDGDYQSRLNEYDNTMYNMLKDNYRERISTYPDGTRVLAEITVYDPKRGVAGTIDFLAVMPDGKTDILDWKFKVINTDIYEDIPWYNIDSWNRQMGQYKTILQNNYGIKSSDFRQTMMIPIRALYTKGNPKENILPSLMEIEIGDVNIKNITSDYLIPVGLESQKTGIVKLDMLLEKLNALYKKLSEKKVLPDERADKKEQLNALFKAIRHLQMKQNIGPLLEQTKTLNKQMEFILKKYEDTFKGKDKSEFSDKQINDFAKEVHLAEEVLNSYKELNSELRFMFEGKDLTDEEKELKEDLRNAVDDIRYSLENLSDMYTEFTVNFIGGTMSAEKIVRGLSKWFGNTATIQLKALEDLYKKANKSLYFTSVDVRREINRLSDIRDSYMKWATAKGLNNKNMFDSIKKKDKNELIDEYDAGFYSELKRRIQTKDYAWLKENIDVAEYQKHLDKKLEEELTRIENKAYTGTEDQIKYSKSIDEAKARDKYSISTPTSLGWLLYNDISKFPNRENWESKEWKELHKKDSSGNYVNKPALDLYNYIRERNAYYASIGYISVPQARTFLPWVRKSFTENLIFNGKSSIGEQFLRNISIDESDVGYGQIDPITGNPIDTIPKYFTSEIENVSEDLFKTMGLYNEMAIKFDYLKKIEDQGRALIRLEKNKKAIATSVFGRTSINDITGELELNPNNVENSQLVEDMVKAIIYQQKYISSETFDQLLGKLGNVTDKINKKLGFNLLPKEVGNRQVSVNKTINTLNNVFQLKTLGLNPLSAASNLFGGKTQSLINSGKYFSKTDYVTTEMWLLANKMGGSDKKKMLAALEYFMPFTHDYNRTATEKLSLTMLDDHVVQNVLMGLMRKGEEAVQTTNFFAFLKNSIVVDGKVVNTREYLRSTPEYASMYAGSEQEREARASKFEEDVKKLNEEKGVITLGTVVNGEFVIPGVDQKDDSVVELRRKVQQFSNDALGSASEENKRAINMTVYGNSLMIFKNWIPRLVDVRYGGLKYNAASDAYEWGRLRTINKIIADDLIKATGRLYNSLVANDKGIEYLRELYEKKREDYKMSTGKELRMTEDQFIELVRQNIKNQLFDVLILAGMYALFIALKAMAPDDDEDPQVVNMHKYALKATDKFRDELLYFYDPTSLTSLVSSGIFPSVGLINDYKKVINHTSQELYGMVIGDEELIESNKTVKYWMRTFPVISQAANLLPMFSPDLADDLGIEMQSEYGFQ